MSLEYGNFVAIFCVVVFQTKLSATMDEKLSAETAVDNLSKELKLLVESHENEKELLRNSIQENDSSEVKLNEHRCL